MLVDASYTYSFLLTPPADFFLVAYDQSGRILYCVKNQELRVASTPVAQ